MSLEELRAQAADEENAITEEVETPEEEIAEEPEVEPDKGETEGESEDFELELEGEPDTTQQKPSAEEALIHKLTKQKKRAQSAESKADEAESKAEALQKRLDELEARLSQPQRQPSAAMPKMPVLYENGVDTVEKYDQAVKQWWADMKAYDTRHSEADNAQEKYKADVRARTEALAKKAAAFSKEHKVNVDRVADAIEKATSEIDTVAGIDGAMAYLLDSVGDGSERVAYYIGTNEGALSQVKGILKDDPNGLKAIAHMTRLAEKLKPKSKRLISAAPDPDQPVKGDASSSPSAQKLQDMWDKETDLGKLKEIRKQARELGVSLK